MAKNGGGGGGASAPARSAPERPTITLPPRTAAESLFTGGGGGVGFSGISPGPMTLVSSFFADGDSYPSFSQLLAGAVASPSAFGGSRPQPPPTEAAKDEDPGGGNGGDGDFRFKLNRPAGLAITQPSMFTIPPGLSPATLLDSPGFAGLFSPVQGPYGMSHQQALAQVTSQAAQAQVQMPIQPDYPSSTAAPATSYSQLQTITSDATINQQQLPPQSSDHNNNITEESSEFSHSVQRSEPASFPVDKPADDGYNWRKYGQKHVKGSEYPRSYYKCTYQDCPVKKKVERALDGQITEIIYKGQHNHPKPQNRKGAKDTGNTNGAYGTEPNSEGLTTDFNKPKDQESSQATHVSGSSESEEVGDAETRTDTRDEDERESKRRAIETQVSDPAASHRTVTEPRIIVQTTSEVDLLDDGYRWRKYGQKVVKGNPYPRSYYKCTNPACNVRKHVERAANDPKAVMTTYEGRHNHDVPAARNSSHNTSNINPTPQLRPHNVSGQQQQAAGLRRTDYSGNEQQGAALLRFKEEQIT